MPIREFAITANMPTQGEAHFELIFRPSADLVAIVRRFVSDFYDRILSSADTVSRLALATHELLENAVKYAVDGVTTLCIIVDRRGEENGISIRISNRAAESDIARLTNLFAEMTAAPDAFEYYQAVIKRAAREPDGSGLGLARVRCEGEMTLTLMVQGEMVSIVAQATIEGRT